MMIDEMMRMIMIDDDDQAHLALLKITNLSLLYTYNAKKHQTKSILK